MQAPTDGEVNHAVRRLMKAPHARGGVMDSIDVGANTFHFAPVLDRRGAQKTVRTGAWDCRR